MGNLERIKVVLVDDHPAFREGLCRLLIEEESLEVIGQAANGEEAVTLTQKLNPDVVIMDIAMPRLNGIEATKKIKKISPQTAVLILSAFRYQSYQLVAFGLERRVISLKMLRSGNW